MKTVFLMFSRSFVVRNILRTNVFALLRERQDLRFVLFVPPNIPDYFRAEFNDPRIIFEETPELDYGQFRKKIFDVTLSGLVYTSTSKFMARYGGRMYRKLNKNIVAAWWTHWRSTILSKPRFVKTIFRWLELHLYPDYVYDHYFEQYHPDLVVATTVMSKRDRALLKGACRHNVPTIGITRGWDNLDRLFMPVVPDLLLVQNELMRDIAVKLHAIPKEKIAVVGFPQFDLYLKKEIYEPRETFLRSLKLDPERAVIFYGPEGQWAPNDEHIVRIIYDFIKKNELVRPCSLIIRPHFSDVALGRYNEFKGLPNVHLDEKFRLTPFFTDQWDPDAAEMNHLANELKHCDMLITFISTLAIEAAIFDKPIINIDFYADTEPDQGPYFGRWYQANHYKPLIKSGAVQLAKSKENLKQLINGALLNPEQARQERATLADMMAYKVDGHAGERMAAAILNFLDSNLKLT